MISVKATTFSLCSRQKPGSRFWLPPPPHSGQPALTRPLHQRPFPPTSSAHPQRVHLSSPSQSPVICKLPARPPDCDNSLPPLLPHPHPVLVLSPCTAPGIFHYTLGHFRISQGALRRLRTQALLGGVHRLLFGSHSRPMLSSPTPSSCSSLTFWTQPSLGNFAQAFPTARTHWLAPCLVERMGSFRSQLRSCSLCEM